MGQTAGAVIVEGYEQVVWARGSIIRKQTVRFFTRAWQGIGGASADTSQALKYLLKQVEEIAGNRDMPTYIQWESTAQGGQVNLFELHDGWYLLDDFEATYEGIDYPLPIAECRMTVTHVAPAAPRRVALGYSGGALASNYSGAAINLISLPVGATAMETTFTRTGGEGAIPCIAAPAASPEPFVFSTTLTNIWKGGVHVYDTINTGTNAIPTAASGLFVNANWVEVFGIDHDFVGDCVVTNGLQLLLFVTGQTRLCLNYLWNTAAANIGWQQYGVLYWQDNASASGIERAYSLVRVGPEECAMTINSSTSANGQVASHTIRMQRGRYEVRVDFRPLSQATTVSSSLLLQLVAIPKLVFNSTKAADNVLSESAPVFATDYGYGAAFVANTAQPFIAGLLYQNQPGASQPGILAGNDVYLSLGDTTSLAINGQRSYGFFAVPYGISGSFSTANLQAEAEGGTLGSGWTSQANGSASGGNEAKCASGTLTGNSDTFGVSFLPAPGGYDLLVRVKVTATASTTAQMFLGLWDVTGATPVPLSGSTFAPSQLTTGYAWVRANQRTVADGVLNTTTTVTSATAVFVAAQDAGKSITGIGIPAGTTIASVTNATTIVLSAAATATASGVTLTIGRAITPTAAHNMQFRAQTIATLATDFFIDEAVLVPRTLTAANAGPQDIAQQFMFDRSTRWIRP